VAMPDMSAGPIRLFVLGDARIETPVGEIEPTAELVFAAALYLILERKEPVSRRTLERILWPDADDSVASHRLRQTLLKLSKSGLKVHIIQSIDRKLDLVDVAEAKGLKIDDIIAELESIVHSGTRVNISYYIDEMLDEEKQEEIVDYFREAEDDSVQSALDELGEDEYSEEEIRLMRIKFISEFGN
jgi:two-component SAPR family response regulator